MNEKCCTRCGKSKPLTEFYPYADGKRQSACKPCSKAAATAWKRSNADLVAARQTTRRNTDAFRARHREYVKTPEVAAQRRHTEKLSNARHPLRRKARIAVANAISAGKLSPTPCWICGDRAEAHHADYSAPLDVVWLCRAHHVATHKLASKLTKQVGA